METPNVAYTRDEVTAMLPRWELIRDAISGEPAIKAERTKYLPMPNSLDQSVENRARYDSYLTRATFYNVTQRTHQGLVGQCFAKDPVLELPGNLDILENDIDGAGVTFLQQAKEALGLVLAHGRAGLLTDYPVLPEGRKAASVKEQKEGRIRPSVLLYNPWDIINWRTRVIGGLRQLSLVVLPETFIVKDDGFQMELDTQYRVLRIDPANNFYKVEIWKKVQGATPGTATFQIDSLSYPKDSRGKNLTEIPFTFIGAVNNDEKVDLPPMYDLASLNVSHYRTSADHEWSAYICGQIQPVMTGLTQQWKDANFKGGVQFGSNFTTPLPTGGDFKLVQAAPNTLTGEMLKEKERRMVALGARLVEQKQVQRTLGEARMEYATELSILGSCSENVVDAYLKASKFAGMFAGVESEATFELFPEAELEKLTPEERKQLMAEWQGKAITWGEYRTQLRRGGLATEDDEKAKEMIANETPDFGPGAQGSAGFDDPNNPNLDPNVGTDGPQE